MTIEKYFDGKEVLVTGATGLMGKALVEKLLRSCPGIAKIYVIIRAKRGCDPKDRWAATTQSRLFDYLKKKDPASLSKVVVIAGDGGKDEFGLSDHDQKMLIQNVSVVYHGAASINFFNTVSRSLEMNLKSTFSLLELAKKMKKLERFVHVSTAYCHFSVKGEIQEEVYESQLDWRTMLELIKVREQADFLDALQPKIMNGHVTTYTLTKALAENAVKDYNQYFPTIIIRPALVTGTAKDPEPGWMDVDNVITLFSIGIRLGVIRLVPMGKNTAVEMIPLDLAVRGMIVAPWKQSVHTSKGTDVYCERIADKYRLMMGDLQYAMKLNHSMPSPNALWYNFMFHTNNTWLYGIGFFLLQVIPGFFIDVALKLSNQTPKLKRIYTESWRNNSLAAYYNNPHHTFADVKFRELESFVPEEDKNAFSMDYSDYDKLKVMVATHKNLIAHAWKDTNIHDEALKERARKRYKRLTALHFFLCGLGFMILVTSLPSLLL